MKLERIEVRRLTLPLRTPFETSFGRTEAKQFLLVSASADGLTGLGECVADVDPFYLPETNETVLHVLRDFLAPIALRLSIEHPRELLPAFARVRGHEMAKAALEMAVYELWARRSSEPLWRVLGGRGGEIQSGVSIGLQRDDAALVDAVAREAAAGYRRVKIKIKPGRDVALVSAVRDRFPELPLMVDANSAYTLADGSRLAELDRFGLTMIEQPLGWDDIVDHAVLQKRLATPICLDESIHGVDDARRALELGACRVVNIKVGRVGGFTGALAVHDLCRARSVPVWCGGMHEFGVGRAANIALASLPGFSLPSDVSGSDKYFASDVVAPPIRADRGEVRVPWEEPGIGFAVDEERVRREASARLELRS